jgi:Flp pilus assembly protein TadB
VRSAAPCRAGGGRGSKKSIKAPKTGQDKGTDTKGRIPELQKEKQKEKRGTVKRLLLANLFALFALFFVTVVALWAMGLLGSILAFIF